MSKKLSKNGFVIGVVLLVFGSYWTYNTYQRTVLVKASQDWPSVTGKVMSAEVKTRTKTGRKRKRRARSRRTVSYPAIKNSYEVNGQSYTNDRLSIVGAHSGKEAAQACVERYAVGTEVQVYYDPDKPTQAILERDTGSAKVSDYFFPGGVMIFAGVAFIAMKIIVKK